MPDANNPRQLVVFTLGTEHYALAIQQVHEIIRYSEPRSVASRADWVRGVISLRGLLRVQAPSGTVWNLCSGRAVRVSEVVRVVLEQLGTRREVHFASPDTRTMVGDHTKLQTATGWTPRHGLDEMVAYALGVQHG